MKYIVYMAAGNSSRFGENKLFYPLEGREVFTWSLDMLKELSALRTDTFLTVVTQYNEIGAYAKEHGIDYIINPDSIKGVSYTIRAALEHLLKEKNLTEHDYIMFVVADQPYLRAESVEKLLDADKSKIDAVSLSFNGQVGNPVIFSGGLIPDLLSLEGDKGGRSVLKGRAVHYIEAVEARELMDIDTKSDVITII